MTPHPPMAVHAWKEAYEQGLSMDEVAAQFRTTRSTIARAFNRIGYKRRDRHVSCRWRDQFRGRWAAAYARGLSLQYIARQYGVGESTVRLALIDAGVKLRHRLEHYEIRRREMERLST
jgi:transposase